MFASLSRASARSRLPLPPSLPRAAAMAAATKTAATATFSLASAALKKAAFPSALPPFAVLSNGMASFAVTRRLRNPFPPRAPLFYDPTPTASPQFEKLELPVTSLNNEPRGMVRLHPLVFGRDVRIDIVHRVVRWEQAKARGWSTRRTKTRAEIVGSNRKPHPQKKTGRARQGTRNKAPHQRGGGKAHGPVIRNFAFKLQKKVINYGFCTTLSSKYLDRLIEVIDTTEVNENQGKTKFGAQLIDSRGWNSALLVDPSPSQLFVRSVHNLDHHLLVIEPRRVSVYEMVRRSKIIFTLQGLQRMQGMLLGLRRMHDTQLIEGGGNADGEHADLQDNDGSEGDAQQQPQQQPQQQQQQQQTVA